MPLKERNSKLFHRWVKAVGGGGEDVYYRQLSINTRFRLLSYCSVFQPEFTAIEVAIDLIARDIFLASQKADHNRSKHDALIF